MERIETVIVGGGQAGLAMSYWLTAAGREHVILERGRVAERWRSERWDSLTVLTPNWAVTLPGHDYAGDEPDGFMGKDEYVSFVEDYATELGAPLRTGVNVTAVREVPGETARFRVESDQGEIEATNVVAATGPFQEPGLPAWSADAPSGQFQVHSSRYRNPDQLPPGEILVVGAGASGQQIAEELVAAGRKVFLSVGHHRPAYRRYRGRDWSWWQTATGFFDRVVDDALTAQTGAVQTGAGGGHDLLLRNLAADGATLLGYIRGLRGTTVHMAPDLAENIRAGDESISYFTAQFDAYIEREGMAAPPEPSRPLLPDPREMDDPLLELDLPAAGVSTIVWATGFRYAFDWLHLPVLDETGRPRHVRGVTSCPGLYFLGLRRQYKVKSSFIMGVGEDAAYLAEQITGGH